MLPDGILGSKKYPGISDVGYHFKTLDPIKEGGKIRRNSIRSTVVRGMSHPVSDAFFYWANVVGVYTQSVLARDEDRLIAISAITKHMATAVKDEYVAGLWRRQLPYHLLWEVWSSVHSPPETCVRPEVYIAPTWSWASVRGPCTLFEGIDHSKEDSMIQVLEISIKRKGPDPMGAVLAGMLGLRCWMKTVRLHRDTSAWSDDYWHIAKNSTDSVRAVFDEKAVGDGEWYFMPVLEHPDGVFGASIHGLILLQNDNFNEFRRVGKFNSTRNTYSDFCRPIYKKNADGKGPEVTYGDFDERGAGTFGRRILQYPPRAG